LKETRSCRLVGVGERRIMRHRKLLSLLLGIAFCVVPAQATGRLIVRVNGGPLVIQTLCRVLGCTVAENIDGAAGQLFLVTAPDTINLTTLLNTLVNLSAVTDAELDLVAHTADSGYEVPGSLSDTTPTNYYGATVAHGYINQPATQLTRVAETQSAFNVSGRGVVAVIDTGVDTTHPAFGGVLVPGYDFTRNRSGADEKQDVNLSPDSVTATSEPSWVSGKSAADVDQSTAAVVDGNPQYSDFGHGTMVAGVVHLVAPTAKILPLKAFRSDGTSYTSDILRAIYWAIASHANVLNMSFNLAAYSPEVATALNLADASGMISVAAAGNSGHQTLVYPAALWDVMGVASTSNEDELSSFSNYGPQLVWVGAPGEGVVTTYPFSTYAAAWGTSFSTPFVSGLSALLLSVNPFCNQYSSSQSAAHAQPINDMVGHGRLDTYRAVQSWVGGSY
jgi:hypothetical protein